MSSARDIPHFDEAMAILKPVAERVYELLEQAAPNLDDHNHESFNQSVYAALKVLHRSLDVDTVSAHSDLPTIADSLPLLIEGFERCRPFWKGTTRSDWPDEMPPVELMNPTTLLLLIGEEIYPARNSGEFYFEVVELDELSPRDR